MADGASEVAWAPRVRRLDIRLLYESEAQGRLDEELLEEVAIGLYARCESWCLAFEARKGVVHCPRCNTLIAHHHRPEDELLCPCGWQTTWKAYYRTIKRHQLSGMAPVADLFRAYQHRYDTAASPRDKMLAIDELLHAFHLMLALPRWHLSEKWTPGRNVAVNLITGNYHEVITFLDTLNYGPNASPEMLAQRRAWRRTVARTTRLWNDEKLQHFLEYEGD